MNFSSLSALDRRIVMTAGLALIAAILSFLDSSGSWGPVMFLAVIGGALGVFVAMQPQVAPTTRLPMTKGLAVLVAGALATGGFALSMLSYVGYISRNLLDPFVIIMLVGLVASVVLLLTGWQTFQTEPKAAASSGTAAAAPAAPAPAAPPAAPAPTESPNTSSDTPPSTSA